MKIPAGWGALILCLATPALAQDGNRQAFQIATGSPEVKAVLAELTRSAQAITEPPLRQAALSALDDQACLLHRQGLTPEDKVQIIERLVLAGSLPAPQDAAERQQQVTGLFPPVTAEDSPCPLRPQAFLGAPGGNSGSHHDWPGGLVLHEAFNLRQSRDLVRAWREESGVTLDQDLLTTAVIWHDWAKALVFQWRADGSERPEIQLAGTGVHHVLALAEAMDRGLPVSLVRTMACAHAAPLGRDEKKVEGWLKAAAIIARKESDTPLYTAAPWPQACFVHTLSDQNWLISEPAAEVADASLARIADRFALVPGTADYNWRLRLPALAQIGAMPLWQVWQDGGDMAVEAKLRQSGLPLKTP